MDLRPGTAIRTERWDRPIYRLALSLIAALLIAAFAIGSAEASPVRGFEARCGDRIPGGGTVVLQNDVGPCPGDGLIVHAANVTLDLNGHRVFGTPRMNDGIGLRVRGRRGVSVINGTVQGFDAGIALESPGREVTIRGMLISGNGVGIRTLFGADGNAIRDNTIVDNTMTGVLLGSSGNVVEGNTIARNGIGTRDAAMCGLGTCDGIHVSGGILPDGLGGNVIRSNIVRENRANGISLGCTRDRTRDPANPPCAMHDQRNVVTGNLVLDNGGALAGTRHLQTDPDSPDHRFLVGVFDLLDGNNHVNPGVAVACDNNDWMGNEFETAFPACTAG